ncbi:MAG: hypothetical protein Q9163_003506 [Psora crenata]
MVAQLPLSLKFPQAQNSHLTTNLISVFKLDSLAATVARFDPFTGEKINKMRKSYEGQLKTLGLAGKNKSIKHDEAIAGGAKMMGLSEMAAWPEEEWQNQKTHGKSITKGLPEAVKAKLEKAMDLRPGPVPEGSKWEDILGIDRVVVPNANKGRKDPKINGQGVNGVPAKAQSNAPVAVAGASEPIRARRNTKKRRYDDGSFEGYGEGFVDDDLDLDMGYTSGETYASRNSRGDKKRRKTKVSLLVAGYNPTNYSLPTQKTPSHPPHPRIYTYKSELKDFTNSPTAYGGSSRTPLSNAGPYGR